MEKRRVEQWLRRTVVSEMGHSILFAASCLALSAVVLTLTIAIAAVLVWLVMDVAAHLGIAPTPAVRVWIGSGGVLLLVGLLFWSNARATRRHLGAVSDGENRGPHGEGIEPRRIPAWGSLLAYPGAGSLGVLDIFCTGPRLTMIAWSHLRRAWRLRGTEVGACASVVVAMLPRRTRCQLRELLRHRDVSQPLRQLAQLRELGGVTFFRNAPYGFSLRSSWRQALAAELAGSWDDVERPGTALTGGKGATIAEQVLGVSPGASAADVERAYRHQIKEVTDATVVGADPDLQRIASEHARAVRSAYDEFMARHGSGKEGLDRGSVEQVWEQHRRKQTGGGPQARS